MVNVSIIKLVMKCIILITNHFKYVNVDMLFCITEKLYVKSGDSWAAVARFFFHTIHI
jgi:hypothetical protein